MKKIICIALALVLVLCLFAGCGNDSTSTPGASNDKPADKPKDEVITLTLTTHEVETGTAAKYVKYMCDLIEEKTGGRVVVDIFWAGTMAGPLDSFDTVLNGSADMSWTTSLFVPGMYPLADVLALPYCGITSGPMGTAVAWELFQRNEDLQKEWSQLKIITFHTNGATPIASAKPINSLADLNGLRVRCGAEAAITWANELGMISQSFPLNDLYENLSKNVVDGALNDYQALDSYRAYEVLNTVLEAGLYYPTSGIIMNLDTWNNLPADIQEIFTNEICTLENWLAGGNNWWSSDTELREFFKEQGVKVVFPDQEMYDAMKAAADAATAKWISDKEAAGLPAQKIYDDMQAIIAEIADDYASYAPDWYETIEE